MSKCKRFLNKILWNPHYVDKWCFVFVEISILYDLIEYFSKFRLLITSVFVGQGFFAFSTLFTTLNKYFKNMWKSPIISMNSNVFYRLYCGNLSTLYIFN